MEKERRAKNALPIIDSFIAKGKIVAWCSSRSSERRRIFTGMKGIQGMISFFKSLSSPSSLSSLSPKPPQTAM